MCPKTLSCSMRKQGFPRGSCLVENSSSSMKPACQITLRHSEMGYERLIRSFHLSRPEDYLSIYQSGCNSHCLKCHSHEFSKVASGEWMSTDFLALAAESYRRQVNVFEPRDAATSWHAHRLCKHCGSCVLRGEPSPQCPGKLRKDQVVLGPQGFGPARNIVAFTGGDILCKPKFYIEATQKIKEACPDLWVLLETNGYGLTPQNLEAYAQGGVDAFWLDIKAFSEKKYRKLCGTKNAHILSSVQQIVDLDFALEILTLFIPGLVETDEHLEIAKLIVEVDPNIPTTLLAFFPCYKLSESPNRAPSVQEMVKSFLVMRGEGLRNLRLGNLGVFLKNNQDASYLFEILGADLF
ncbi:MAG: radical SAM protein [Candidatus Heimdallarchaeota archaeon]